jgi:hypothetical protein
MLSDSQKYKPEIRTFRLIHFAMVIGQFFFIAIVLFLVFTSKLEENNNDLNAVFICLVPFLAVVGLISSISTFRIRLRVARSEPVLIEKLTEYRSALIIRYAIIEGVSIFSIVISMVTGKLLYLGIAAILVLYFLALAPTAERVAHDLELTPDDKLKITGNE